jgi:hypothetical protein
MRQVIAFLLAIGCTSVAMSASQARGGAASGRRISACALLTPDVMAKFDTGKAEVLKLFKPEEEPVGVNGTYCEYGGVGLQVNPFARPDDMRKSPAKDWQPVTGVGDTAFFHNNRNLYAELMVFTGPNHFTIQLHVPTGGTAESVRPKAIGLANAIIPKLR